MSSNNIEIIESFFSRGKESKNKSESTKLMESKLISQISDEMFKSIQKGTFQEEYYL